MVIDLLEFEDSRSTYTCDTDNLHTGCEYVDLPLPDSHTSGMSFFYVISLGYYSIDMVV
jgi:hypothetical protein